MAADPWQELRVELDDDDPDFDLLTREEQDDVLHAIRVYAKTGQGGTVAQRARGAAPYEVLRAGRIEIDARINVSHPKGPTLVVGGFSLTAYEDTDD